LIVTTSPQGLILVVSLSVKEAEAMPHGTPPSCPLLWGRKDKAPDIKPGDYPEDCGVCQHIAEERKEKPPCQQKKGKG